MTLITVACDLCGGREFITLFPATIPDPEEAPQRYFSSHRQVAGHLRIVRCRQCGMVLTNPRDDEETLDRIYASLEDEIYSREEPNRERTADERLAWIESRMSPARLLDVGCSTGVFVRRAAQRGWQVTGLDSSRWAIELAKAQCPDGTFLAQSVLESDFWQGSFDLITLWDVLEHLPSPRQALMTLHPWLTETGWLAINVPNVESRTARWLGARWVLYLREHLWYFSPKTITALLTLTGYQVVGVRPNRVRFSLANVFQRLGQYPGVLGRLSGSMAGWEWLRRISLAFSMGEMQVLARKIGA